MSVIVSIERVVPRVIAAVRRQVALGQVAGAFREPLDQVWAFLRTQPGLVSGGHNVFLYEHPARRGAPMTVHFGVEVARDFAAAGEVQAVRTPAGEVATATHVGPYARLRTTHDAVHAWLAAHERTPAGTSWEVYGDWQQDPSKLETTVFYLLQ